MKSKKVESKSTESKKALKSPAKGGEISGCFDCCGLDVLHGFGYESLRRFLPFNKDTFVYDETGGYGQYTRTDPTDWNTERYNPPSWDRFLNKRKRAIIATTIPKQEVAIASLKAGGFKIIQTFINPNTGTEVSIWYSPPKEVDENDGDYNPPYEDEDPN